MIFNRETMEVGGKISLPDSLIAKTCGFEEGEIVEINDSRIKVRYSKEGQKSNIFAIYTFRWLNMTYGDDEDKDKEKLDDKIPF